MQLVTTVVRPTLPGRYLSKSEVYNTDSWPRISSVCFAVDELDDLPQYTTLGSELTNPTDDVWNSFCQQIPPMLWGLRGRTVLWQFGLLRSFSSRTPLCWITPPHHHHPPTPTMCRVFDPQRAFRSSRCEVMKRTYEMHCCAGGTRTMFWLVQGILVLRFFVTSCSSTEICFAQAVHAHDHTQP